MSHKNQGNIFSDLPTGQLTNEVFETLWQGKDFKLERIISTGQVTPNDQWCDQSRDEWVLLLKGRAELLFDDGKTIKLMAGDYILIPAHKQHRVIWTDPEQVCVWLAFHVKNGSSSD